VTTGTYGSFGANPLAPGDALQKSWSGGDGKHEIINGFLRDKWNNYSSDVVGVNVKQPYFVVQIYFNGLPDHAEQISVPWNNGYFAFDEPQFYKPAYRPVSECLDDLLSRVKGHDFNLGVELGQMHQTVSLLADNLGKLGRAALALRRGDFANAARCLGASTRKNTRLIASDISGRWLELQYGWLPLISTCFDAVTAFHELTRGPRSVTFRASRSRKATWNLSTAPGNFTLNVEGKVRTAISYEMTEELSFTRQLGLEDPLSVAWELTPWSFVVDWFYPIGNYLSLLNQVPKLKGRFLMTDSLSVKHQGVVSSYHPNSWGGPAFTGKVLQSPEWRYWMTKTRRVVTDSPPQVPSPKFNMGLNSSRRFWNALSLAHQRFKPKHIITEHPNEPKPGQIDGGFYDPDTGYSE
jgi:hypothetical protein